MLGKLKASGSRWTPGIEAALKTWRLKLAAKLIDRVKTNEQVITKKQSLQHSLAQNAPEEDEQSWAIQTRMLETLVRRKRADVNSADSQKSTSLIYAAINWNAHLSSEFSKLMNIRKILLLCIKTNWRVGTGRGRLDGQRRILRDRLQMRNINAFTNHRSRACDDSPYFP